MPQPPKRKGGNALAEESLAIESLMSMKLIPSTTTSCTTLIHTTPPPPPVGPSDEEVRELKTSRAKAALESWYRRLHELYQFKLEHGHCDVPQKYPENRCLGIWVNKQRCEKVMYEEDLNHKTNLTPKKLIELEKIGFIWAKRKGDVIWNQRYNELLEFYKEHGHSDLPCKYKPKPTLGRWVTSQRSMYKRGSLPPDCIEKLDAIGFTWDMYAKQVAESEAVEALVSEKGFWSNQSQNHHCCVESSTSSVSSCDQDKKENTNVLLSKKRRISTTSEKSCQQPGQEETSLLVHGGSDLHAPIESTTSNTTAENSIAFLRNTKMIKIEEGEEIVRNVVTTTHITDDEGSVPATCTSTIMSLVVVSHESSSSKSSSSLEGVDDGSHEPLVAV